MITRFLKNTSKKTILILMLIITLLVSLSVPTLSRFADGNLPAFLEIWDGSVATSYNSGTGSLEDPYIISSGSEFAYFANMLETTNYEGTYFKLGSDIILNEGFFSYQEDIITYNYLNEEYYVKTYTNEVYSDSLFENKIDVKINLFNKMKDFSGHFDGSFYSIYGLYVTDEVSDNLSLFENLSGTFNNVFIENYLLVGGSNTSGLSNSINNLNTENVYMHGNVVSTKKSLEVTENIVLDNFNFTTNLNGIEITPFDIVDNGKKIISSNLTGNYVVDNEENITYDISLSNQPITLGEFSVDLGNTPLDEVLMTLTSDLQERNISLINLNYTYTYENSFSSGLSNNSSNVNINNFINDLNVNNNINASGFIYNANDNTVINNSYNIGNIKASNNTSGIIGNTSGNNIIVNKVYNNGLLDSTNKSGLINTVNTGNDILIKNSFNNEMSDLVYKSTHDNHLIENSYTKDEMDLLALSKNEFYELLELSNFKENADNNWLYNELPELFFMEELELIDVRIFNDKWNNLDSELSNVYYNKDVKVTVTSSSPTYTLEKVEYIVVDGSSPITLEYLELATWENYTGSFEINLEGEYLVYVKLTDYSGDYKYINTDIINIDKTLPTGEIVLDNSSWDNFRSDVNELVILDAVNININSNDADTGIKSVKYFISEEVINEEDLAKLNEANWITYNSEVNIDPVGENILYASVEDMSGNISYMNTDIITYSGYNMTFMSAGRNDMYPDETLVNITSKSSVTTNFVFNIPSEPLIDYNHMLKVNNTLPLGTLITLKDNINDKRYEYTVTTDDLTKKTFRFRDFLEVGSIDQKFGESSYDNGTNITENFTITLDFKNAAIVENLLNNQIWLEVQDYNGVTTRNTLYSTIVPFNIYSNSDATLGVITDVDSFNLKYNADSIINFNLLSQVNYLNASGSTIWDTTIEEQDIVLNLSFTDNFGNSIDRNRLNHFLLRIDGVDYYPDTNGNVLINLENGLINLDKVVELHLYKGDSFISLGDYKVVIKAFVSYNDIMTDFITTKELSFNVAEDVLAENVKFSYSLGVDKILEKEKLIDTLNINSLLGGVTSPELKISLYKKNLYDGTNQDYTLVDLNTYLVNPLEVDIYGVHILPSGNINLELNTSLMDKQSYKLVVEAYSGETKLREKEEYFIVK